MAAKKDFSKDAADIFGLQERKEREALQRNGMAEGLRDMQVTPILSAAPAAMRATVSQDGPVAADVPGSTAPQKRGSVASSDVSDTLTTKTFRISRRQHKALQMRMAMSDDPAEKDLSSIVRAALEAYLRPELDSLS